MKRLVLVFLFSIVVMLVAVSFFGIGDVFGIVASSDLNYILLAAISQLVIMLLYGLRMKIMASKYKNIPLKEAFYTATIGNFVSLITPVAKIGGQPLMVYLVKPRIGNAKASAIVLSDIIADIFSSVLLIAAVLIIFHSLIPYPVLLPLLLFTLVALVMIAGFMKLFLSRAILTRLIGWFVKKVKRFRKINKIYQARLFERSFRLVVEDKKLVTGGMATSFGIKFFELLRMWFVFASIGIFLDIPILLIVWSVTLLLLAIPWLPGSLGLFELGASSVFILFGLASGEAAGGVILDRFVSFWFVIAVSLVVVVLSKRQISHVLKLAEKKKY